MRLTLDVTPLLLRSAGVKNHLHYWAQALEAARGVNRIEFYPWVKSGEVFGGLDHEAGFYRGIPDPRLAFVVAMNRNATHGITRAMAGTFDVLHGSPQLQRAPKTRRLSSHVHDLTCWIMPEMHTGANVDAAKTMAEEVWRKADGLIAVSESAKDDAVRILNLEPEKIAVIHHGVPESFFNALFESKPAAGKPYVLALGTIEPRKNLLRLIEAWRGLPGDVREQFELRVAGPVGWKAQDVVAALQQSDDVRYVGYLPEQELPGTMAGASALAFPSLYEGFGFPLAQAMACGVASLTSNRSSLPEVAAGSALLVDPLSVEDIRAGLLRLLTSPALRADLGARGREHAIRHYRWPEIARRSWDYFERLAA